MLTSFNNDRNCINTIEQQQNNHITPYNTITQNKTTEQENNNSENSNSIQQQ